jgi:hypothetical protein
MMDFLGKFGATAHKAAASDSLRQKNAWSVF